jgi:hypothetical protein
MSSVPNEELHNLYPSPNIIRKSRSKSTRWSEHVRILVGKPERKMPLERPRRRRVNNIKMDLREIG